MLRSKIRSLFYVMCGAAIVPACGGDDTSASGDGTETEGDTEGDDADDAVGDDDPSVTVTDSDPDTTDGQDETTESGTTATTADESSSDGGPCLIPEQIFEDPSFEEAGGWPAWAQASTNFGTPLCDAGCGIDGASDGAFYAWFGGVAAPEVGGLAQEVLINEADELTFSFDFQIQASSGNPEERFYVTIDGTEVFSATPEDAATYAKHTQVDIDVSAYADGQAHEFEFIGITLGGDPSTNFFLDNLQMGGCDAGMAVTIGDSVTGIDPNDNPVAMCDEDLAGELPLTVMGTTVDQGNDAQGSCTGGTGGEEVVYSWTAPAAGTYQFDTLTSAADTVLYVYDACMDGEEIGCHDDVTFPDITQSVVVLDLAADQTVAIAVDAYDSTLGGEFELHISAVGCGTPTDLMSALPVTESGDNAGAGDDVTPSCVPAVGGEDVAYTWSAPSAGFYSFDTIGSSFDTVLAVYDGVCGSFPDELGCAADGTISEFSTLLSAGQALSIVVDGAGVGEQGAFDLNITQTGTLAGDCCAADATAGCEDAAVTICVCDFDESGFAVAPDDATCCTGEWSDFCASLAGAACNAGCNDLTPGGSCCDAANAGGCDVAEVQDCVCAFDDYCCDTAWDAECVEKASLYCFAECN